MTLQRRDTDQLERAFTKNNTEAYPRKISYRIHVREPYSSINYVER